jgi:hypothetical protein
VRGSFRADESAWPVVVYTFEGPLEDTQVDAYAVDGTRLLARGEPYVVVVDVQSLGPVSAYARARYKRWAEDNAEALRARCRGAAYVMPSPLLRFITMTLFLVVPLPMPYAVCKDLDEAMAWAKKQLYG